MNPKVTLHSAGATHVGRVRDHNEDAYLRRDDAGLWAVADGMGGHHKGEVASAAVVDALAGLPEAAEPRARLTAVQEALEGVHDRLVEASTREGVSGTTAVVLLASDDHVAAVWAGDSRVYRWRGGRLDQLSRDHSLVQEMVDQGQISPQEARRHPWRNRVTSAIGAGGAWRHEVVGDRVEPGDRYLLCSDGLTECVDDTAIAATLADDDPDAAVQRLIAQTLDAGAPDNVTVVVVMAEPASPPAATGDEPPDHEAPTRVPDNRRRA